jgi:putative transposase
MKRSRFSEEQIIGISKEHRTGMSAGDLRRKHGLSEATFYKWRKKYGGMEVSEAKRLKALEAGKRRLSGATSTLSTICGDESRHHSKGRKRSREAGDGRSAPALWQYRRESHVWGLAWRLYRRLCCEIRYRYALPPSKKDQGRVILNPIGGGWAIYRGNVG